MLKEHPTAEKKDAISDNHEKSAIAKATFKEEGALRRARCFCLEDQEAPGRGGAPDDKR